MREDEWSAQEIKYYITTHNYALSSRDDTPLLATKVLELPHLRGNSRTKRVILSLERERSVENGHMRFFMELRVENGDKHTVADN